MEKKKNKIKRLKNEKNGGKYQNFTKKVKILLWR